MVVGKLALKGLYRSKRVNNINRHWCKGVVGMKKVFGFLMAGVFSACLVLPGSSAFAATITASSCSQSDVQAAVSKSVAGDIVQIPAGNCTWSNVVTINKNITLKGAGATSTVIKAASATTSVFNMIGKARITSLGFYVSGTHDAGTIRVSGKGWRIDNCKIEHSVGGYGVWAQGSSFESNPAGLIDNNTFKDARILAAGVTAFNDQHKVWANDADLGSQDAIYVEDNSLYRTMTGNVVDGNRGGKYVLRYNKIYNSEAQAHAVQSSSNRGTRSWEIYGNTFISNRTDFYKRPIFLRAGEGVVFNNTVTGTWSTGSFNLDSRRAYDKVPDLCDGNSWLDQNLDGQNGWICRDQPGAGRDMKLSVGTTLAAQTRSPVYAWGNTFPFSPNLQSGMHIKANRDYYDNGKMGVQTSKTSPFNGSSGTGIGSFSNMPGSCAAGTGYWASDAGENWNKLNDKQNDGALYKCTSTNTWSLYYTPYYYPHPLRSGVSEPPPADLQDSINSPSNIRVVQ